MATQLGEKIAAEFGFHQFPVDPFDIAQQREIAVQAKPADVKGVSGAIIFANDKVTIIYSNEYENAGFEHFSLGHERMCCKVFGNEAHGIWLRCSPES
ncbi:hypothetical protein [Mesorhizobium qingshengii]|nr:hypothetical protein [Mesorhizobium qingshengii]